MDKENRWTIMMYTAHNLYSKIFFFTNSIHLYKENTVIYRRNINNMQLFLVMINKNIYW